MPDKPDLTTKELSRNRIFKKVEKNMPTFYLPSLLRNNCRFIFLDLSALFLIKDSILVPYESKNFYQNLLLKLKHLIRALNLQ